MYNIDFGFQIIVWGTYRSEHEDRREVSNNELGLEEEEDLQEWDE